MIKSYSTASEMSSAIDAATGSKQSVVVKPKYILVTGSRDWPEKKYDQIANYFAKQAGIGKFVLIEGECRGADLMARRAAEQLGMEVIPMPITKDDWKRYGHGAGPVRNREMLKLLTKKRADGHPIDVVWFHEHLSASRGTKDAVKQAKKLGLTPVCGGGSEE